MNEPKLLPCPFCGGQANLHNDEGEYWYVACRECINQTTHFYNGREVVITRWNARVPAEFDPSVTNHVHSNENAEPPES